MPRTRPLHHPPPTRPERRRLAFPRDFPPQPQFLQPLARELRVVAAVEVDARLLGQRTQHLGRRLEGRRQERRVMAIGRGAHGAHGDARSVYRHRTLEASFAPVHGVSSRLLPTARGLGDAAIHRYLRKLQADEAVVSHKGDLPEPLHQSELYPFVAPPTQGALRAGTVGDPLVGAAEGQDLDQFLEDEPVGDARAVAAQRMSGLAFGQEDTKLLPDGLDDVCWECGHGAYSFCSGSVKNSPDGGASVPALHAKALPIDGTPKCYLKLALLHRRECRS